MAVLAQADFADLAKRWTGLSDLPDYEILRAPEHGLIMTRGRMGGTGDPFNLGEMTVTRCSVRTDGGKLGHAYIPGRGKRHAEIAAVCDALLLDPRHHARISSEIVEPLAALGNRRRREKQAKAATTKVEFFTLVRGED